MISFRYVVLLVDDIPGRLRVQVVDDLAIRETHEITGTTVIACRRKRFVLRGFEFRTINSLVATFFDVYYCQFIVKNIVTLLKILP